MRLGATWFYRVRPFRRTCRNCYAATAQKNQRNSRIFGRPEPALRSAALVSAGEVEVYVLARADRHALEHRRTEPPIAHRRDALVINVLLQGLKQFRVGDCPL